MGELIISSLHRTVDASQKSQLIQCSHLNKGARQYYMEYMLLHAELLWHNETRIESGSGKDVSEQNLLAEMLHQLARGEKTAVGIEVEQKQILPEDRLSASEQQLAMSPRKVSRLTCSTALISAAHCPLRIVEDADALPLQKQRHSLGIADAGDRACQHDAVKTRNNTFDFITMSFNEIRYARSFQYNYVGQLSEKRRAA